MPHGLTATVAEATAATTFDALPETVVTVAKQCILDWTGVALAGSGEPVVAMLGDELAGEGAGGSCTAFGRGLSLGARDAALLNGTAGHALDFDDVVAAMSGHPSAPLAPAVIALGERTGASGRDLVTAFVAGFEAECRIGLSVLPGHYRRGWHATGTVGTFGAAAGCSRILGLDADRTEVALGIAAAQASGLKSLFGTMCKPLQAGKAAACGLLAAVLAERGFTSIHDALEAPQGFAATGTDTFDPAAGSAPSGEPWQIRSVLFKHHAACFFTHATIEGVLRLKQQARVEASDVRRVVLRVPEGHLSACNIVAPTTALEGKFSLRFTAALALTTGDVSEAAFTEAAVADPEIDVVRRRVEVEAVSGMASHTSETVIELHDGTTHRLVVDMEAPARSEAEIDDQGSRLAAKFATIVTPVLGSAGTKELLAVLGELEEAPSVRDLTRLCSREGAAS